MAAYVADLVAQYTPTTGTGSVTLAAVVPGHRSFSSAFGSGQVYYCIRDTVNGDWETGLGTISGSTLARTTVYNSSNGGSKVAFSAGDKIVYNEIPSAALFDKSAADQLYLTLDGSNQMSGPIVWPSATPKGTRIQIPLSDGTGAFLISNDPDPDIPGHHIRLVMGTTGGADGKLAIQSGTGSFLLLDPMNRMISADGPITIGNPTTFTSALTVGGSLSAQAAGFTTIATSGNANIGGTGYFGGTIQAATGLLSLNGIVEIRGVSTTGNRELVFTDIDATERARIFSNGDDDTLHLRVRTASTTRTELVLGTDGSITMPVGYWQGLTFGRQIAGARNDLSKHLRLHEDGYGLSITGASLNLNLNTGAAAYFVWADATIIAQVDPPSTALSNPTLLTVAKADPRYRDASNLNAGTVDPARLPTSAAEGYRVMALVAAASVGAIGSTELLRRVTAGTNIQKGETISGSNLRYAGLSVTPANAQTEAADNTAPPGSWMAVSSIVGSGAGYTIGLFRRVA